VYPRGYFSDFPHHSFTAVKEWCGKRNFLVLQAAPIATLGQTNKAWAFLLDDYSMIIPLTSSGCPLLPIEQFHRIVPE